MKTNRVLELFFFQDQKLISASVLLVLKRKVFFFLQPCSLAPYRYHCLFVEFVSLDNRCKSPPLWIPPQPTICQRGTKSDVRPIMRAVSGNPAAESPPCRLVPSHTSPWLDWQLCLTLNNLHMMTLSNDIPLLDAKLLGGRAELLRVMMLTDCTSSLPAKPTLRQYDDCNVLVLKKNSDNRSSQSIGKSKRWCFLTNK